MGHYNRSKKGQSSVEYLSVVGIAMLLLIPATILFMNYTKSTTDEVLANQLDLIGNTIMGKAEEMYVTGAGSWVTINVNVPDVVESVTIYNNSELVFRHGTTSGVSDVVFFSYRFDINNGGDCDPSCDVGLVPGPNRVRIMLNSTGLTSVIQIEKV